MQMFLKRLGRSFHENFITRPPKSSSVGSLIACGSIGKPIWTPRQYDALSQEGYQRNVIVYRSISLIARGIASVPWLLYKRDGQHEYEIENNPLLELLNNPSPRQASSSFMEAVVGYLLLSGNSYVEAVLNEDNKPCELYPLRSDRMKIIPGLNGDVDSYEYGVSGRTKKFSVNEITGASNILHIKTFNPLNDWYGFSPIEAAANSIDQHNVVGGITWH